MNDLSYGGAVVHTGSADDVLPLLEDDSIQCCVTSPPYWGLRDYGTGRWVGGDPAHQHDTTPARGGRGGSGAPGKQTPGSFPSVLAVPVCSCGAKRVDDQLGLEPTPEEYTARLVEVFREVRRVLCESGTLWLNLGDSYNAYNGNRGASTSFQAATEEACPSLSPEHGLTCKSLKPKDLVGIPWRVAFALQADGWYLRSDIIWAKPNPMPESVTDRPTKAHEYLFLLSKNARYHYDAEKLYEPCLSPGGRQARFDEAPRHGRAGARASGLIRAGGDGEMRNGRSVWSINTEPYKGAHFAVMPDELAGRCILAGCPRGGTVLDPFAGSGTTMAAAITRRRKAVGIELNPDYMELIRRRVRKAYRGRGWGLTY